MNHIPSVIHYCWYGGKKKGSDIQRCIDSWKKFFPNYEIQEWNESNTDIESNIYIKEAYENKKYAFVSDVVRLQALLQYGGVYFDTDVEVIKDMRPYFQNVDLVCGFESDQVLATCFLAVCENNNIVKEILSYYQNRRFVKSDGNLDLIANPTIWTKIFCKYGLTCNGNLQEFSKERWAYPSDYFSAYDGPSLSYVITENTCCIHHCSASWLSEKERFLLAAKKKVVKIIGGEKYASIKQLFKK